MTSPNWVGFTLFLANGSSLDSLSLQWKQKGVMPVQTDTDWDTKRRKHNEHGFKVSLKALQFGLI